MTYNNLKPTDFVVADDNSRLRYFLHKISEDFVKTEGMIDATVTEAEDGKEAYQAITNLLEKGRRPLLITDNSMPRMNGFELYLALPEDQRRRTIVVTADQEQFLKEIGDIQAPTILRKPYLPSTLIDKIKEYF